MFENICAHVIIFFQKKDERLKPLLIKNLVHHSNRNLKMSMMFMFTLAFLVFCNANFQQIEWICINFAKNLAGSDIVIANTDFNTNYPSLLDEFKM